LIHLTYDELVRMPQHTVAATLECAGNGRAGFGEVAKGEVPWGNGAVGTAKWIGVPLKELLADSGIARNATQVVAEGRDFGPVRDQPGPIHFVRTLPIAKALDGDTILALRMNSKTLPNDHGFPARLVVPGWYGMASVKWVRTIRVLSCPLLRTFFNSTKYIYASRRGSTPVTEMRVKSLVTFPLEGERIRVGQLVTIAGKAWSGSGSIRRVEVAVGGKWKDAKVEQRMGRHGWATWTFIWRPLRRGVISVATRATDDAGTCQPAQPLDNRYQYGFNAIQSFKVNVFD